MNGEYYDDDHGDDQKDLEEDITSRAHDVESILLNIIGGETSGSRRFELSRRVHEPDGKAASYLGDIHEDNRPDGYHEDEDDSSMLDDLQDHMAEKDENADLQHGQENGGVWLGLK